MPFFLLEIDNVAFYAKEKSSVDPHPLIRWPWLDSFWGIVDEFVEGVLLRDPSARSAEMIVQAEPDFLARWNFWGDVIKGYYPTGEMIVDKEGAIYHVTSSDLTQLEGVFAHDLFAPLIPDRVEDIDTELLSRSEEYVLEKIREELDPEGESNISEVAFRCLTEIDLRTADYRDINACIEKAMRILAQQHFQSEES
jgi:hypothetical protein